MFHRFSSPAARIATAVVLFAGISAPAATYVKTSSSGQGLYATADENSKVATLPSGTVMATRAGSSGMNGWIQVSAPDCVDCYVFDDSVDNGVVAVTSVKVRTAPNSMSPEVARLLKGEPVIVRGKQKGWISIAPPASASFWVKADSVVPTSEGSSKTPAPVSQPTPVAQAPAPVLPSCTPTPPAPSHSPAPVSPVVEPPAPVAPITPVAPVTPTPITPAPVVTSTTRAPEPTPVAVTQPAPAIVPAWTPPANDATPAPPATPKEAKPVTPVQTVVTTSRPTPVVTPTTRKPTTPKPVATVPRTTPQTTTWQPRPATQRPVATATTPLPVNVPSPASVGTSDWERPAAGNARPAAAAPSVAAALSDVGNKTLLPKVKADPEWDDPSPGTLFPSRHRTPPAVRVPDEIADEKLSATFVQGKPGRAVGTLVHDEGGLFPGSRYEIRTFSDDGTSSEFVAVVHGRPEMLNPLVGRVVRADGTVWWLIGKSSTPHLVVESVTALR